MFLNVFHIFLVIITCFYWLIFVFTKFTDHSIAPLVALSASTIWVTAYFSWTKFFKTEERRSRIFFSCMMSVFSPIIMYCFTHLFYAVNMEHQKKKYYLEIEAEQQNENGFLKVKTFADSHFGIPLRLGGYDESWALTELNIPQASVASLRTETGYCTINLSKGNINHMYKSSKYIGSLQEWELLILAHEFAHCLDRTRDLSPRMGGNVLSKSSLPPALRKGVKDINSFLKAEEDKSTVKWREIFADLFAIGYMQIEYPDNAKSLKDSLIYYRKDYSGESTHETSCWLKYSSEFYKPKSLSEVNNWADFIREKAPCKLD